MKSKTIYKPNKVKEREQSKLINSYNKLRNIKSNSVLKIIFSFIHERKSLETIKYNKFIQKSIDININTYKTYSEKYSSIKIEITLKKNINIYKNMIANFTIEDERYYHIYLNDDKENELLRPYLYRQDNASKINIIIDYQIKSFSRLFYDCENHEYIYFKKFLRNNITDMSHMFYGCSSLIKINFNNFNTNNVIDMSDMFGRCLSLKKINS